MATVSFANLDQSFDFILDTVVTYDSGSADELPPASWEWTSAGGSNNTVTLTGTGFTFTGDAPTGGLVNGFILDLDGDGSPDEAELVVTGLSFNLTLLDPMRTLGAPLAHNLFWQTLLSGDDTIDFGTSAPMVRFAGDGRAITSGFAAGGNDTFTGSLGGHVDSAVSGDYQVVSAGATVFGGVDQFFVTGGPIIGDVAGVFGSLSGGDDLISPTAGTVSVISGDAYAASAGATVVGGDDTIVLAGTVTVGGEHTSGDVTLSIDALVIGGDDTIISQDGAQVLIGDVTGQTGSSALLHGGDDAIAAGAGDDQLYGEYHTLIGGTVVGGNDQLFGEAGNDQLFGQTGNDILDGGGDDDTLFGGTGNDQLFGGAGVDSVDGDEGNDTLLVSVAGDVNATETYNGDLGTDVLTFLALVAGNYSVSLQQVTLSGLEALTFADPGLNQSATILIRAGQIAAGQLSTTATITGNTFPDVTDTLAVMMDGINLNLSTLVMVNFGDALDSVTVTGDTDAETITGADTATVFNGGGGNDTLNGQSANDVYVLGTLADNVNLHINDLGGTGDTITSSITRSLVFADYSEIENLTLTGNNNIDATGSNGDNVLTGNSGANTLSGGTGNDTLDGGSGADGLIGGANNDTYVLGAEASGVDTVTDVSGTDTITSTITRSLVGYFGIENLTLVGLANINATGDGNANVITGNSGNNTLNGGGGADTLNGGLGNDSYLLGSGTATISDAGGRDTIFTTITRDLSGFATVDDLLLLGTDNINGIGNALFNGILGNNGNNVLAGGGGNDALEGRGGIDSLFGQAGQDSLVGGAGNDTFFYQTASDSVAGPTCDYIRDFDDADNDKIDLNGVFVGTLAYIGVANAFTGANQVRSQVVGANIVVAVNLDGDAAPEMQILLLATTAAQMGADDFVL